MAKGSPSDQDYLIKVISQEGIEEECLVDLWMSHQRFSFVDLTAGPFKWGPSISGEGTRTVHSLPLVPDRKQRLLSSGRPKKGI